MDELRERLMELEIRLTHHSRQLEELNEVLTDACTRIDLLERENRALRDHVHRSVPDDLTLSPDE